MDKAVVGVTLIAVGLILLIGSAIYGANALSDCHDKSGVMMQGQCVKVEVIK